MRGAEDKVAIFNPCAHVGKRACFFVVVQHHQAVGVCALRYRQANGRPADIMHRLAVFVKQLELVQRKIASASKREGEGLGVSSVSAVAKKHGGAARFEADGNVFHSSVYLWLDNNGA